MAIPYASFTSNILFNIGMHSPLNRKHPVLATCQSKRVWTQLASCCLRSLMLYAAIKNKIDAYALPPATSEGLTYVLCY